MLDIIILLIVQVLRLFFHAILQPLPTLPELTGFFFFTIFADNSVGPVANQVDIRCIIGPSLCSVLVENISVPNNYHSATLSYFM